MEIEYRLEGSEIIYKCKFDLDVCEYLEIDIIEKFYYVLYFCKLRNLKSFTILNLNKTFHLNADTENEKYSQLYNYILCERELNNAERSAIDCYKNYLKAREKYYN